MPTRPRPYRYWRWPTREVMVGDVGVGGRNPIRVQSMTTPATSDVKATVDQAQRLVAAGCEIVRVTVPSKADAEALPAIKAELTRRGLRVPLVADIHFTPAAALLAVEHVEKVRVNPGNYADKKKFAQREYSDSEYRLELERIGERFVPLVRRARELGVALRIGTNHGSLSDRIMNRYGDTALGMVESALEFVRIAAGEGHHDLVLSMKASNPLVCIEAYRLLAERMDAEGMAYPLHLGVTEAGDGEDGRVKSAIGIGALLEEGLGDTVRVSLTEDPVAEIPVALELVRPYNRRWSERRDADPGERSPRRPARAYQRRGSDELRLGELVCGGRNPPLVEQRVEGVDAQTLLACAREALLAREQPADLVELWLSDAQPLAAVAASLRGFPRESSRLALRLAPGLVAADAALAPLLPQVLRVAGLPAADLDRGEWESRLERLLALLAEHRTCYLASAAPADVPHFLARELEDPAVAGPAETVLLAAGLAERAGVPCMLGLEPVGGEHEVPAARYLHERLEALSNRLPVLLAADPRRLEGSALLATAVALGSPLADGLGDALRVDGAPSEAEGRQWGYTLLQSTRLRLSRADFISCPSCGRTLFDLEQTTARIKARTAHLKGVKIAIMGCIVNGPGEMADADFGYVGWGPGKVSLFVGHQLVVKDIPTAEADARLIELIKQHGRWTDPPA